MLVIENKDFKQISIFNQLFPESCLKLQGELAIVDKILSDETIFKPFI